MGSRRLASSSDDGATYTIVVCIIALLVEWVAFTFVVMLVNWGFETSFNTGRAALTMVVLHWVYMVIHAWVGVPRVAMRDVEHER